MAGQLCLSISLPQGADCSFKCDGEVSPLDAATDELHWKRQCSTRSSQTIPRRLAATVRLLKNAEGSRKKRMSADSDVANRASSVVSGSSFSSHVLAKLARGTADSAASGGADGHISQPGLYTCHTPQLGAYSECNSTTLDFQQAGIPISSPREAATEWDSSDSSCGSSSSSLPSRDEDAGSEAGAAGPMAA